MTIKHLNNHSKESLRCKNVIVVLNDAATFDHKMHPNSIDDLIGLKRKTLNPISFLLVDVFSEKI